MVRKVLLLIVLLLLSGTAWAQEKNRWIDNDDGPTKETHGARSDSGDGDEDGEGGLTGPGVDERSHAEGDTG